MQHRVVVRRGGRPWGWLVAAAVAVVVLSGASYSAYRYWGAAGTVLFVDQGSDLAQLREERRRLSRELRAAREELAEKGRSTFEARSCEIDTQACEAVRASAAGLEAQVADLREQLAFYRNVAAPEQEVRAGVRVMRMSLRPTAEAGVWRYELVLVQPTRRDRTATGTWDLRVAGTQGKQMKTLKLADLQAAGSADRAFAFRSFQEFGGELKLPSGFLPSRLTVTLQVQDGKSETAEVEESFDWSRLAAAKE